LERQAALEVTGASVGATSSPIGEFPEAECLDDLEIDDGIRDLNLG